MHRRVTRLLLCAALAVVGSARAATQLKPQLSLMAEERYDDDLLLRQAAGGAGQFLTKLSASLGAEVLDHSYTLHGWYAPDLMFHSGSGTTSIDHRGDLSLKDQLSEEWKLDADLQVWRVSDPTSLPRLGMAKTLSPVLYGKGTADAIWHFAPRWNGVLGISSEASHVYDNVSKPGFVENPFVKALYALSKRASLAAEYRYSLFLYGDERANAHTLTGEYGYRISRELVMRFAAGPIFFTRDGHPEGSGLLPKLNLDLERVGPRLNWGFVIGHDLVGASGFAAAIWADYASFAGTYKFSPPFHVLWAASFYRNGEVPNHDAFSTRLSGPGLSSGYAVGGGLEWQPQREFAVRATVDRYSQVGVQFAGAPDLTRNVYALRLIYTAW